ncbi:MAG: translation initiation factor IF-2 [Phycisphaerales bacterium]|nr:translation initiation factor IF-2 [Phycisphaerales bacterium]
MAKGIRVNQLAKELGVESKLILAKCRDEGLGDKVPNHMSTLAIGLAETVREWFSSGGGVGTAVETAAPVEVAAPKVKTARKTKKKVEEPAESTETTETVEKAEKAEPVVAKKRTTRKAKAPVEPAVEPEAQAEVAEVAPVVSDAPVQPVETPAAEPVVVALDTTVSEPTTVAPAAEVAAPVKPAAPAAHPPETTKHAETHRAGHETTRPASRPTVSISNRQGPTHVERKPVVPAARLVTPEPAKIQGPRVVREEKPDVVPAPRPRRPIGGGGGPTDAPSYTQARPQGGRGVRSTSDDEGGDEDSKKKAASKASGRTLSNRRRGTDGRRGEAMEKLKEYTEADLIERRDRLNAASAHRTAFDSHLKKSAGRGTHEQAKSIVQRGAPVKIEEPITVKSLAAALGVKSNDIISKLMRQGVFATVNQGLARESAELMALEYGVELRVQQEQTLEELFEQELSQRESAAEDLVRRPPVVTILGHVDHGKTSLLDKIRNANVAAGESGGITQHTAAWMVQLGEKRVTFIDTPGHQAFTSMRARGANMTDVVVLVVSAAEGVQPQTVESINHARAAEVPIVVAMNKIDRADANPDMVLGQLAKEGLNPVEWGGDIEVVRTSATTGQGVPELIEILDYQAELLDLKTDPKVSARGMVIESRMDEGLGSIATVLVQDGVLKVGDIALSGAGYGRVRSLLNDRGQSIAEAGASTPVIVSGLSVLPSAGDKFYVVEDLEQARSIAEERASRTRKNQLAQQNRVTADNLLATMKAGDIQTINLIIKGDVQGSVETLVGTVTGSNTEEVKVKVIHSGVGAISESDVELALATKAKPTDNQVVIVGFHVVPDDAARALAEQNHVEIKLYKVIYEIFDDLKKRLSGMLEPEIREKLHGHTEVRQVFKVSKLGNIAGCMVTDGHIQRGSKIRLIRDGRVITEDLSIETLRRVKEDVREVKQGFECGIKLAGYDDIKVGDVLEAYVRETFQRTL